MEKKEIFKTWDNWCLKKLKEIGRSTLKEWAEAMGYKYPLLLNNVIKNNIDKLIITPAPRKRSKFYELKEELE